ncbi:MAG: 23S rRNA (adenine(2503)-C(2))-methyltransferase RlmN [Verrucomicrobiaceae bacterium]|nr:23S rRNA (adenine(2503)-C(2))-methyltransferase RlmN [Verrucomicrobiaceae bacterium]
MPSLHDLTHAQLAAVIAEAGLAAVHGKALWNTLHFRSMAEPLQRADLSPPLRRWLERVLGENEWSLDVLPIASDIPSSDGLTRKALLRLTDGQEIETVIMGYQGRHTACISTQAGCAMGCVFCATGQMGFVRHLRPGEIVAQVHHARRVLAGTGQKLRNLVFMGMGEPLHNYDAVMTALDIITHTSGINLGPSKVSISTVGVVPGILRLAEENRPYNLAVSLHAATDEERSAIVPANTKWPLPVLMDVCRFYNAKTGRRIFFAWTLIQGVNDTPDHAHRVAELLRGLDAHVNLIPLNETAGYSGTESPDSAADAFHRILQEAGYPCTIRQRRGIDVAAGCGQLRAEKQKRK